MVRLWFSVSQLPSQGKSLLTGLLKEVTQYFSGYLSFHCLHCVDMAILFQLPLPLDAIKRSGIGTVLKKEQEKEGPSQVGSELRAVMNRIMQR